jgi:hypothetical protein
MEKKSGFRMKITDPQHFVDYKIRKYANGLVLTGMIIRIKTEHHRRKESGK